MSEQASSKAREYLIRRDNRFMRETFMPDAFNELVALLDAFHAERLAEAQSSPRVPDEQREQVVAVLNREFHGNDTGWHACSLCGCPERAGHFSGCIIAQIAAQSSPRAGSEALDDLAREIMDVFWPNGTSEEQDGTFDAQLAKVAQLLAAATAERTPQGPIELTPVNYDPVMARTHLLVPKDMKCHKCGAEEPWKDGMLEEVAATLKSLETLADRQPPSAAKPDATPEPQGQAGGESALAITMREHAEDAEELEQLRDNFSVLTAKLEALRDEWRQEASEYQKFPAAADTLTMGDVLDGCADELSALLPKLAAPEQEAPDGND